MFGFLPDFLLTKEQREMERRYYEADRDRRLKLCVPWDPQMKWAKELNLTADSYHPLILFPEVEPSPVHNVSEEMPKSCVISPQGTFLFYVKILPRGGKLATVKGRERGTVMFDGPVNIPALHQKCNWADGWDRDPWMSLTPMEIMSLRSGTKFAKGKVIVAGLGLGHQLIEVSKRKQVKELVLVERSQELVDWLLPRLKPLLGMDVKVVVGDARKVLPTMTADVALIDIFPGYGSNSFHYRCSDIRKIWCWGSASIG